MPIGWHELIQILTGAARLHTCALPPHSSNLLSDWCQMINLNRGSPSALRELYFHPDLIPRQPSRCSVDSS